MAGRGRNSGAHGSQGAGYSPLGAEWCVPKRLSGRGAFLRQWASVGFQVRFQALIPHIDPGLPPPAFTRSIMSTKFT